MPKQEKLNKALFKAADKADLAKLQKALADGAEVNATIGEYPCEGWTALFLAANRNSRECVRLMLKAGADVKWKAQGVIDADATGSTVLHALLLPDAPPDIRILKDLLDAEAEINAATKGGVTALSLAASRGNLDCVKLLLQRGSTAQLVENKGTTVLLEAARSGSLLVVKLLLEHGAPLNILDDFKMSPLSGACWEGHPRIVELLLKNGANPNLIDASGRTAFHAVCDFANRSRSPEGRSAAIEIGEMLLKATARLDVRDKDGRLALDYLDDDYAAPVASWLRGKIANQKA